MTRRDILKAIPLLTFSFAAFPDIDAIAGVKANNGEKQKKKPGSVAFPDEKARAGVAKKLYSGQLFLCRPHGKDHLKIRYLDKKGRFDRNACRRLNHFFRCPHTGEAVSVHPDLFLLLDATRNRLGAKERPYILISGYRSPRYNRLLAGKDAQVAHHSYHVKGMAADVVLEGVRLKDLERTAKRLSGGGVGHYEQFVHLDVGPVRSW